MKKFSWWEIEREYWDLEKFWNPILFRDTEAIEWEKKREIWDLVKLHVCLLPPPIILNFTSTSAGCNHMTIIWPADFGLGKISSFGLRRRKSKKRGAGNGGFACVSVWERENFWNWVHNAKWHLWCSCSSSATLTSWVRVLNFQHYSHLLVFLNS